MVAAKQRERQPGSPHNLGDHHHPKTFPVECDQAEIAEIPPPGASWSAECPYRSSAGTGLRREARQRRAAQTLAPATLSYVNGGLRATVDAHCLLASLGLEVQGGEGTPGVVVHPAFESLNTPTKPEHRKDKVRKTGVTIVAGADGVARDAVWRLKWSDVIFTSPP